MDLFTSVLPKKEQLRLFCKDKEFIRTSDVVRWGAENYCPDAIRRAQELAQDGLLRRLDEKEKIFRGFRTREGVWRYVYENERGKQ